MPLTVEQKAQAVTHLTTHVPAWKGQEAVLNGLKDEVLVDIYNDKVKLQDADGVINSVRDYLGDKALVANAMPAALAKKAADCKCDDNKGKPPVTNANPAPAAPQHDGTVEGWFKATNAPPQVVQVVTNALAIVGERKAELAGKLTAHISDPTAKAAAVATYNKLEPADLKVMVDNMAAPTQATVNALTPPVPSRLQPLFIGGAGGGNGGGTPTTGPTTNANPPAMKPLGLPTIDHATFWKDTQAKA